jgi:hypothetical protein
MPHETQSRFGFPTERLPLLPGLRPLPSVRRCKHRPPNAALTDWKEAIRRCRGPEQAWMAQDLKRAMILIGGLDEEMAQRILDQEGG